MKGNDVGTRLGNDIAIERVGKYILRAVGCRRPRRSSKYRKQKSSRSSRVRFVGANRLRSGEEIVDEFPKLKFWGLSRRCTLTPTEIEARQVEAHVPRLEGRSNAEDYASNTTETVPAHRHLSDYGELQLFNHQWPRISCKPDDLSPRQSECLLRLCY